MSISHGKLNAMLKMAYIAMNQSCPPDNSQELLNKILVWKRLLPAEMTDEELELAFMQVLQEKPFFPTPADICQKWQEILAHRPTKIEQEPVIEKLMPTREREAWWFQKIFSKLRGTPDPGEWDESKPKTVLVRMRGHEILNPEVLGELPPGYTQPEIPDHKPKALSPAYQTELLEWESKNPQPNAFVSAREALSTGLRKIEKKD